MNIQRLGQDRPLVSVCVPTLDIDSGRVQQLVESVVATVKLPYEVVIADCEGKLLGYTRPMNAAMAEARGQWLVAINDDVRLSRGWLEPLLGSLTQDHHWCCTPDATHTDGPQVFHPWLQVWRRKGWAAIGGLDKQFIFWCSDIDLARRLVDCKRPPIKVELPIPVHHDLNATASEHPQALGAICQEDLARFHQKWGVSAEEEKHRLAAL